MSNSANIELKATGASDVDKELSRTQGLVQTFASSLTAAFTGITAAIKVAEFGKEIFNWGKFFVEAASEAEQNSVRLGAVLKAVGTDVGFTKDQLMELSSQLQDTTKFEDDMAQKAIANALKFKNVRGPVFKEMIKLSADLAEQDGGSLVGASDKLARALNDPMHGFMRLRMEGVLFSESQKDMIKTLTESGDVMGAQQVILDAVKKSVGGVAAEMGNTMSGQVEKLKNRFGDMSESIGAMLLPFLKMLVPVIETVAVGLENLVPVVEAWVNTLKVGLDSLIELWRPTFESLVEGAVISFAAITVAIENWQEVSALVFNKFLLAVIGVYEDVKDLLTVKLVSAVLWLATNWSKIWTDLETFMLTVLMNMTKNIGEFIAGVKRYLQTGSADFKFTALTEGFESTLSELPTFGARAKTEIEKQLEGAILGTSMDLMGKIASRSSSMAAMLKDLFKKKSKDVDMTSQENKVFDEFKKDEAIVEKKKGFGVGETELERNLFGPQSKNAGGFEDLVAQNKRISSAAAQNDPINRVQKAVVDAGVKQAEKLDALINVLKPSVESQEEAAKSLKLMEKGVPSVLA